MDMADDNENSYCENNDVIVSGSLLNISHRYERGNHTNLQTEGATLSLDQPECHRNASVNKGTIDDLHMQWGFVPDIFCPAIISSHGQ